MLWFFLIVSLMVISAIVMLVLPMLCSRTVSPDGRDQQNIAIAKERLTQLQLQIDDGVLDEGLAAEQRKEIERGLIDDIESGADTLSGPEQAGVWAGIAVAVLVPFLSVLLYLQLGKPASFLQSIEPSTADTALPDGHADVDIQSVVARLESELQQNADNPEGWYLLGSTYMTLQRFSEAAQAFGKLRELVGDEPDLLVREADALAMANQGVLAGAPENLLERALALNPDHPVALWLSGIAADRRGDVEEALRYWQRAEPLFADNPQSQAEIRTQISRAKGRLAGGGAGMVVAEGSSAPTEQPIADGGAIQVRVSLDDTLRADLSGNETLFILARAVTGPPMPLAVVRKRAADLPLVVTLDDSMAMMPNLKLSGHDQVTVLAKLSKSGNAATQSGDFIGEVTPVTPGTSNPVNVVISTISP